MHVAVCKYVCTHIHIGGNDDDDGDGDEDGDDKQTFPRTSPATCRWKEKICRTTDQSREALGRSGCNDLREDPPHWHILRA